MVAPWYPRPGIKRLDASSVKQISVANNTGGLDATLKLVDRQADGVAAYGHLFDGKYYACCITVWINKQTKTYSLSCEFADIQGVLTTRSTPMSVSVLDCCDLAMSQIFEWLKLGILQPQPFQLDSTESVVQLLAELDDEVAREPAREQEGVSIVLFVPVYPSKVGFKELDRHSKAEAGMASTLFDAGIVLEGSPMDELTSWMTRKDELRAFVLSWDCDPAQGWTPLHFQHSKL